ncbi:DNA mismatch repair protein MutL [Testicularia cyperi]|uniref:DNA mismatch repair protein MutL n=1 Tax=Testicularia cyperi TaxID=1882483 RepID=A0A317XNW1_9BASI|nr:DNA mismatch repair protein MutL [Testicularia cyperi]
MSSPQDAEPVLDPEADSARYRPIRKLDESVVNKIAAGEIIHRPANALKELIENSLDAGATIIRITLKEGGIKMLQIQDNGSGIRHSDLPLLCERFATSKLRHFDDLNAMSTFGFRGEALASISYVTASMHVVSKTHDQQCAYKAYYASGALVPPKPGQPSEPRQCAGTDGTLITAEDLFYNVPQRRRALKSAADEYNRALDVVSKYAVHYGGRGIGFVCRKASSNITDLNTPSSPTNTTLDTIRLLHGNAVAKELVELPYFRDESLGFACRGYISGANWSSKRTTLLCFINNRLVDCPLLKRSVESLYTTLLPKGGHPWIYLALDINPANIDVNVHPTKKEVHFLHEDDIVEHVVQAAQTRLAGANASRTFSFAQAVLPVVAKDLRSQTSTTVGESTEAHQQESNTDQVRPSMRHASSSEGSGSGPISSSKGYPQHLVRVDARTRTLDSMFAASKANALPSSVAAGKKRSPLQLDEAAGLTTASSEDVEDDRIETTEAIREATKRQRLSRQDQRIRDSECSLTSVRQLRADIAKAQHRNLTDIVQNHTFVGVVDLDRGLSLIQHDTKLLLVNHDAFIEEFAYQLFLRQFGNLRKIRLEPAPSLDALILLALETESPSAVPENMDSDSNTAAADNDRESRTRAATRMADVLVQNAEMLNEYFSVSVDTQSRTLTGLPNLLPGVVAGEASESITCAIELDRLPQLLVGLATRVMWDDEQECFETFARQIAASCLPLPPVNEEQAETGEAGIMRRKIKLLWFDNMARSRGRYVPSKNSNQYVVQVAKLPDLYRVFERC